MGAQPCRECGVRAKDLPRQRCTVCALRHAPIGDQVAAARSRLAMVPESLRLKRTKTVMAAAPVGTAWCAGCQSFRDDVDFGKGATTCRACASARSHAAMIEKTYGLTADGYDALLELQGGRCAICRNRPGKKRFAVDHDHTTGAVRGLLCSTDNHDLLGAGYDSIAKLEAAVHYLKHPPATGSWWRPEDGLFVAVEREALSAPLPAEKPAPVQFGAPSAGKPGGGSVAAPATTPAAPRERTGVLAEIHAMTPEGLELIGGTRDERGAVRIYVPRSPDAAPPF